jgi:hypothetical protein
VSGLMLAPLVEPKDDRSMFESPCPALGAVPPSRLIAVRRVAADGVVAAGVAMSDQHRIPAVGREPAIGLVGDLTCGITVPFCSRKVSQLGSMCGRPFWCKRKIGDAATRSGAAMCPAC